MDELEASRYVLLYAIIACVGLTRSTDECYSLLILFLDHLYNDWLLQRVMVQRLHADSHELLRLSNELLSHGLSVVTHAGGDIGKLREFMSLRMR